MNYKLFRALSSHHKIPEARVKELMQTLKTYYNAEDITEDMIQDAAGIDPRLALWWCWSHGLSHTPYYWASRCHTRNDITAISVTGYSKHCQNNRNFLAFCLQVNCFMHWQHLYCVNILEPRPRGEWLSTCGEPVYLNVIVSSYNRIDKLNMWTALALYIYFIVVEDRSSARRIWEISNIGVYRNNLV